jgi:ribonuclease P protein component
VGLISLAGFCEILKFDGSHWNRSIKILKSGTDPAIQMPAGLPGAGSLLAITKQLTLGKYERLKSRKLIEQLFSEGKSFSIYPFKVFFLSSSDIFSTLEKNSGKKKIILQCGVGASARIFKKAVDRNRIKRLMRESYRLQKNALQELLMQHDRVLALFVIYTGKDLPEYKLVSEKIALILQRLTKEI